LLQRANQRTINATKTDTHGRDFVDQIAEIARFTVPWGRQEIELQEIRFASGGAPLLRVRIREGRRFTIFDIDAATAHAWGGAMGDWAQRQLAADPAAAGAPAGSPAGSP
jgi:hypothetical protein